MLRACTHVKLLTLNHHRALYHKHNTVRLDCLIVFKCNISYQALGSKEAAVIILDAFFIHIFLFDSQSYLVNVDNNSSSATAMNATVV